jgi:hypothetical protein
MQGHGGGGLSLERRFPIMSLTKQKLNTRSTKESEIVGADNFMPAICWTQYFMEAQGYQVQDNVLFQDNKSALDGTWLYEVTSVSIGNWQSLRIAMLR